MRKGLQSLLAMCIVGVAQLAAQSVTLPAPRGILSDASDDVRIDPPAPVVTPAKKIKRDDGLRLVAQPEPLLNSPKLPPPGIFPEAIEPPKITAQEPLLDFSLRHEGDNGVRFWARTEYLLWHVSNAPLPNPLITTGDQFDFLPGGVGQPGTRTLLGGSETSFGSTSGIRFTIGGWFNAERNIGLEASAFALQQRTSSFFASSDQGGNPVLAFSFIDRNPNSPAPGESGFQISNPSPLIGLPIVGSVLVESTMQLWGAELNAAFCLWSKPGFEWVLLTGFRYADLTETLHIANTSTDFSTAPPTTWSFNDHFNTRNQFYGSQLGTRLSFQWDRLTLDMTGKVAIGATHEVVDIHGDLAQSGPVPLTLPYGFFTGPSNIGRTSANQFSVLPSAEVRVGCQITRCLSAFVGYDGMYWSQVVRPGNQIDRNVNLTQNASTFGANGGVLIGPAVPAPQFNRSDFWAHGVNFGVEFHY